MLLWLNEFGRLKIMNCRIYCCECNQVVNARLTNGKETYSHRKDLAALPFWKCDVCNNFVGCHHKTRNRTKPLGCIPNIEIKNARKHIHSLIDPFWKSGRIARKTLYSAISNRLGYEYHTAEISSIEEARRVYRIAKNLKMGK